MTTLPSKSFAQIKTEFSTCSDEEFELLRNGIRKLLGWEPTAKLRIHEWPYTQLMLVQGENTQQWVGVCGVSSNLFIENNKCTCCQNFRGLV